ncbi:hypothetical protein VTN00DRAFT_2747 [Thermoascus crustaceus]|uniref:uncharacterized protein n=1 Tax=Thermoascus crustaceus TaxID=5088 RepID=UPI00374449D4
MIRESKLTNLGLCLPPSSARCILEPLAPELRLRILHLCFTGSEHLLCNLRQAVLSEIGYWNVESGRDSSIGQGHPPADTLTNDDDSISKDGLAECLSCSTVLNISEGGHPHSEWRTSGSPAADLCVFADWAFGSEGIRDLKVLAYGDFSNEDRCSQQQVLLCRAPGLSADGKGSNLSYRLMNSAESRVWNEIEGGQETLRACPLHDPMEYPDGT